MKKCTLPVELVERIIAYMNNRPHGEVRIFIDQLAAAEIVKPEEANHDASKDK